MYQDIAMSLQDNQPYPVKREDALATLKLLHAFYRSDEETNWVDVDSEQQSSRLGCANEGVSNLYRTPKT